MMRILQPEIQSNPADCCDSRNPVPERGCVADQPQQHRRRAAIKHSRALHFGHAAATDPAAQDTVAPRRAEDCPPYPDASFVAVIGGGSLPSQNVDANFANIPELSQWAALHFFDGYISKRGACFPFSWRRSKYIYDHIRFWA